MSRPWVSVVDLKLDLGVELEDTRDDAQYADVLSAAVAFVERVRPEFNFSGQQLLLPAPPDDLILGTVRLAARWHQRRKSPDGLYAMDDFGTSRVPSFDPDIERLLGIGRFRGPVIA